MPNAPLNQYPFRSWPIWQQMLVALLPITVLLAFSLGELTRNLEYNYLIKQQREQYSQLTQVLSGTLLDGIISEDKPMLETAIRQTIARDGHLLSIILFNEKQLLLASWQAPNQDAQTHLPLFYKENIDFEGEHFGRIELLISTDKLHQQIIQHVWYVRLGTSLMVIVVIAVMLLLFERIAMAPLQHVRRRLLTLIQREPTLCRLPHSRNEFDHLEASVEQLSNIWQQKQLHAQQLKQACERAEIATQAKSQFVATMSHEIRTPLNAIMGSLSLLNDRLQSPSQRQIVHTAQQASDLLMSLLNAVLDFSKLEQGKLELDTVDFNLNEAMQQMMSTMEPIAIQKHLRLDCINNTDPKSAAMPMLRGDIARIQQIVLNLLGNAIKFSQQGIVTLRYKLHDLDTQQCELCIEVSDQGIGIPEERLEAIFQDFYQFDASYARKYGGVGLGLAISKQLVQLLGGLIQVRSCLGHGSTFSLQIPLEYGQALPQQDTSIEHPLNGYQILLVDDNEANLVVTQLMLEAAGAHVRLAHNGLEAIQEVKQQPPHIILMDLQMPEMDGFCATRQLRQQYNAQQLPIIAMTANTSDEDQTACRTVGMNDYLSKPVVKNTLLETLCKNLLSDAA